MGNCELYAKMFMLSYANFNAVADALGHPPFTILHWSVAEQKKTMADYNWIAFWSFSFYLFAPFTPKLV